MKSIPLKNTPESHLGGLKGGMKGGIREVSLTYLTCLKPFTHRHSARFEGGVCKKYKIVNKNQG